MLAADKQRFVCQIYSYTLPVPARIYPIPVLIHAHNLAWVTIYKLLILWTDVHQHLTPFIHPAGSFSAHRVHDRVSRTVSLDVCFDSWARITQLITNISFQTQTL